MMTLNQLMIECVGKGYRQRSLVKTLSPRKNNLSNVTILSLLQGNTFNPLFQVSSILSLKYFDFAAMRKIIYNAFSSGTEEDLD